MLRVLLLSVVITVAGQGGQPTCPPTWPAPAFWHPGGLRPDGEGLGSLCFGEARHFSALLGVGVFARPQPNPMEWPFFAPCGRQCALLLFVAGVLCSVRALVLWRGRPARVPAVAVVWILADSFEWCCVRAACLQPLPT